MEAKAAVLQARDTSVDQTCSTPLNSAFHSYVTVSELQTVLAPCCSLHCVLGTWPSDRATSFWDRLSPKEPHLAKTEGFLWVCDWSLQTISLQKYQAASTEERKELFKLNDAGIRIKSNKSSLE